MLLPNLVELLDLLVVNFPAYTVIDSSTLIYTA